MAYKISYGIMPNSKKKHHPIRAFTAISAVVLALTLRFLCSEEIGRITDVLFPLTSASSQAAFETFSQKMRAGESFGDSVTAFCLEILNDSDIS